MTYSDTPIEERTHEQLIETATHWFDVAKVLGDDLETALNLCQSYQRDMAMLNAPDPQMVEVRRLFQKYNMTFTENTDEHYGIFLDGEKLDNPEHVDNKTVEVETVELILDEDGKLRFIPGHTDQAIQPTPGWEAEDIEPIEDPDLEWLTEPNPERPSEPEPEICSHQWQWHPDVDIHGWRCTDCTAVARGSKDPAFRDRYAACHLCGRYLNVHGPKCDLNVFHGGA
jgi:hypothetical protein